MTSKHGVIIGIDPGQRCGWAVIQGGVRVDSGVWDVRPKKRKKSPKPRGYWYAQLVHNFETLVSGLLAQGFSPYTVAIEDVAAHKGTMAAHEYGAITALVKLTAYRHNLPVVMIPVSHIKRYATGKGNASKEALVASAMVRWGFTPSRNDESDAMWIAEAARVGGYAPEVQ